jgi:hypothetical protein
LSDIAAIAVVVRLMASFLSSIIWNFYLSGQKQWNEQIWERMMLRVGMRLFITS